MIGYTDIAGLGIRLENLTAVIIDKCIGSDDNPEKWLEPIVERAYCEYTPDRRGITLLISGDITSIDKSALPSIVSIAEPGDLLPLSGEPLSGTTSDVVDFPAALRAVVLLWKQSHEDRPSTPSTPFPAQETGGAEGGCKQPDGLVGRSEIPTGTQIPAATESEEQNEGSVQSPPEGDSYDPSSGEKLIEWPQSAAPLRLIAVNDREIPDLAAECIQALMEQSNPPRIFWFAGTVVRIVRDENQKPFIQRLNRTTSKRCSHLGIPRDVILFLLSI
jgi:hypothetical protein